MNCIKLKVIRGAQLTPKVNKRTKIISENKNVFLIYFVIILCFLINENDDSRCPVHSGYPKLEGGRISINFFVKNFDSVRAIAEAKYIGLRNQGRKNVFQIFQIYGRIVRS